MQAFKQDAQGPQVKRWQTFLIGQGFDAGVADGIFGPQTHQATTAFQAKHHLQADGLVGNVTMGVAMTLGFPLLINADPAKSGPNWPPKPSFGALTGTTARQQIFGKFGFVADPVPGNKENIRLLPDWETRNIIQVTIPQLAGVKGAPSGGKIRFHKDGARQLAAMWQEWEDAGLLDRVLSWSGSFVPRYIRGSTTVLSNHAFGTAFDINVPQNALGAMPALIGHNGSTRELVPIAHKHGFYWGGHFKRLDGMHFEVAQVKP